MPIVDPAVDVTYTVRLMRAEFEEMPGMRLTLRQAARLWRIPESHCAVLLDGLVAEGYLIFERRTGYRRRSMLRRALDFHGR